MKRHCTSFDRISELPCNIMQVILMFLPLEDMVRTSILSRNWRFQWTKVPQLLFEKDLSARCTMERVFGILLLHEGPILKFTLNMVGWDNYFKINEIIRYLSRNGIQELKISKANEECYTLPSSIFSCVELKYLSLYSCVFKPLAFDGFDKLINLELVKVELDSHVSISSCPLLESLTMEVLTYVDQFSVDAPRLKVLSFRGSISVIGFMNTPLLVVLSLTRDDETGENLTIGLMKLLYSLPHLENLVLYYTFFKLLAFEAPQNTFPTVLGSLRKLELLCASLSDYEELSSTLWLIRNSPNLLKLKFEKPQATESIFELGLEKQDYADYHLMKLQELEMVFHPLNFDYLRPDIEFMKFLLDVSPELEKVYLRPCSDERRFKMVLELACYRRASPKAKLVLN